MGRQLRPQLPGVPFHVTARVQGRAAWFTGVERPLENRILAAPRRSDATLLAYAVMPNHLHLVVVQGSQPLSQLMQPLLTRIALLVQRRTGREGHIFERRFRASPCLDPDYLRNAIAYVHLMDFVRSCARTSASMNGLHTIVTSCRANGPNG